MTMPGDWRNSATTAARRWHMPWATARILSCCSPHHLTMARRMITEQPLEVPLTDIGQFTAEPGLWQRDVGGPILPLTPSGWEHSFD